MGNILRDKCDIRDAILDMRIKMPFEEVFRISMFIQRRFLNLKTYTASKRIALYAGFKNEVLTFRIMEHAIKNGKEVYFPRVINTKKILKFVKVEGKHELEIGSYDIPEPIGRYEIQDIKDLDVVVVPGIAFDTSGNRLGYGKGYYDRMLSDIKGHAVLIGLAFDFQTVKTLPAEEHDIRMDMIVTEKRLIRV